MTSLEDQVRLLQWDLALAKGEARRHLQSVDDLLSDARDALLIAFEEDPPSRLTLGIALKRLNRARELTN